MSKSIKKIEIKFLKSILKDDSNWEYIKTHKKNNSSLNLYFSNSNFLNNVKFLKNNVMVTKMSMILEEPLEKCLLCVNIFSSIK
jgi:phosphoenolpyruvate carboxylase